MHGSKWPIISARTRRQRAVEIVHYQPAAAVRKSEAVARDGRPRAVVPARPARGGEVGAQLRGVDHLRMGTTKNHHHA